MKALGNRSSDLNLGKRRIGRPSTMTDFVAEFKTEPVQKCEIEIEVRSDSDSESADKNTNTQLMNNESLAVCSFGSASSSDEAFDSSAFVNTKGKCAEEPVGKRSPMNIH